MKQSLLCKIEQTLTIAYTSTTACKKKIYEKLMIGDVYVFVFYSEIMTILPNQNSKPFYSTSLKNKKLPLEL